MTTRPQIRLPRSLYDRLVAKAEAEDRPVAREAVRAVEAWLGPAKAPIPDHVEVGPLTREQVEGVRPVLDVRDDRRQKIDSLREQVPTVKPIVPSFDPDAPEVEQ